MQSGQATTAAALSSTQFEPLAQVAFPPASQTGAQKVPPSPARQTQPPGQRVSGCARVPAGSQPGAPIASLGADQHGQPLALGRQTPSPVTGGTSRPSATSQASPTFADGAHAFGRQEPKRQASGRVGAVGHHPCTGGLGRLTIERAVPREGQALVWTVTHRVALANGGGGRVDRRGQERLPGRGFGARIGATAPGGLAEAAIAQLTKTVLRARDQNAGERTGALVVALAGSKGIETRHAHAGDRALAAAGGTALAGVGTVSIPLAGELADRSEKWVSEAPQRTAAVLDPLTQD